VPRRSLRGSWCAQQNHALFLAIRAEQIQAAAVELANSDLNGWEARWQDSLDAFGTRRAVWEVLTGKPNLNKDLIERLS
jgi:hypothetical protein